MELFIYPSSISSYWLVWTLILIYLMYVVFFSRDKKKTKMRLSRTERRKQERNTSNVVSLHPVEEQEIRTVNKKPVSSFFQGNPQGYKHRGKHVKR